MLSTLLAATVWSGSVAPDEGRLLATIYDAEQVFLGELAGGSDRHRCTVGVKPLQTLKGEELSGYIYVHDYCKRYHGKWRDGDRGVFFGHPGFYFLLIGPFAADGAPTGTEKHELTRVQAIIDLDAPGLTAKERGRRLTRLLRSKDLALRWNALKYLLGRAPESYPYDEIVADLLAIFDEADDMTRHYVYVILRDCVRGKRPVSAANRDLISARTGGAAGKFAPPKQQGK